MRYKYSPEMQLPFSKWLRRNSQILLNVVPNLFVRVPKIKSNFVFIVGCGHSGTTLLATILSRHSDFFTIGYESEIFYPHYSLKCSREILKSWDKLASQHSKKFILEKTPKHVLCVSKILKINPDSKIIFVIRNGLDNILSLKKRFNNINFAIDRWVSDNKPITRHYQSERAFKIKYEDLTQNTELTLRDICHFLDIKYEKHMLNSNISPYGKNSEILSIRQKQTTMPIYQNSDKWKNELSRDEVKIFWKKENGLMQHLGYDPNDYK